MSQTLIIIRVHDDQEDRDWWDVLGLPHPDRWGLDETFGSDAWIELLMDVQLAPGE
jgi:hypothetical protein